MARIGLSHAPASAWLPVRSAALASAAAAIVLTFGAPAQAVSGGGGSVSCTGSGASVSCSGSWYKGLHNPYVIQIPPRDEERQKAAAERERKWLERCRPLLKADRWGVSRYYYAVSGCEFGRYED